MTQENLKKSITLIGPSSVGKSLLAVELSSRLGYKVLCIDDIIAVVTSEMEHYIGPTPEEQQKYLNKTIEELKEDFETAPLMRNGKYYKIQIKLVQDYIDTYNRYRKMFGNLKPFYSTITNYYTMMYYAKTDEEKINVAAIAYADILELAIKKCEAPVIIDSPAPFGWRVNQMQASSTINMMLLQSACCVDMAKSLNFTQKILTTTSTVLLEPGEDFSRRNAAKNYRENDVLLANLEGYYDCADLVLSVNGLFNNPDDVHLQHRSWFNAENVLQQRKLKNKGEINSVCDQILMHINEMEREREFD